MKEIKKQTMLKKSEMEKNKNARRYLKSIV